MSAALNAMEARMREAAARSARIIAEREEAAYAANRDAALERFRKQWQGVFARHDAPAGALRELARKRLGSFSLRCAVVAALAVETRLERIAA